MPPVVCDGALILCSFGTGPGKLTVLPVGRTLGPTPWATMNDHVPMMNIMPFPTCISPSQPSMSSLGIPGPCVPGTASPAAPPQPTAMGGGNPLIDVSATFQCASFQGVITITFPGQVRTMIP